MSVESELADDIKNDTAIAAIVADRVWPVAAPQNSAHPFVTYRRVPGEVMYTHEGESRIQKAHMQISAVANNYDLVIELADAIRSALSGKQGRFFKDPEDAWNQETGLFVRTQECTITYRKQQ